MALSKQEKLAKRREYYAANRDRMLCAAADYRAKNPDKVLAAHTKWYGKHGAAWARTSYHKNAAPKLAAAAKWRSANNGYHRAKALEAYYADIDAGRARCRSYRSKDVQRHRDRASKWSRENPHKIREKSHRYRARKVAATFEAFSDVEIFDRDGWKCYICDVPVRSDVVRHAHNRAVLEHVVALSKGGSHTRANVRCACFPCNTIKGANLSPEQTRERLNRAKAANDRPQATSASSKRSHRSQAKGSEAVLPVA